MIIEPVLERCGHHQVIIGGVDTERCSSKSSRRFGRHRPVLEPVLQAGG